MKQMEQSKTWAMTLLLRTRSSDAQQSGATSQFFERAQFLRLARVLFFAQADAVMRTAQASA